MPDDGPTWIGPDAALFAEFYDAQHPDPMPRELEYLRRRIEDGGEPVLELACGTGRVLVPLSTDGVDVDGVDVSPAMLERCRARCDATGLGAQLRSQSITELNLPRRYGTIFLASCGLGILVTEKDVAAVVEGVYRHLLPGGVFTLELETPGPVAPRTPRVERATAGDGTTLVLRSADRESDGGATRASDTVVERERDGKVVESERHEMVMRFWEVATVESHLRDGGFVDVRTTKVFTDHEPPNGDRWLSVRARRPDGG